MGYSCATAAANTMDHLMETLCKSRYGNSWTDKVGRMCFWERGREQKDGAIVGHVNRDIDETRWTEKYARHYGAFVAGKCEKIGSFRIEPDGFIKAFPGVEPSIIKQLNARIENRRNVVRALR